MTPLNISGIDNGWIVDDMVWRGAQPNPQAYSELKKRGCDAVMSLRPLNEVPNERGLVIDAGMDYFDMNWNGVLPPTQDQIHLAMMVLDRDKPVFVHCQHGKDRTGTLCACYRIKRYGWSVWQAEMEAIECGELEVWMALSAAEYEHNLTKEKT